MGGDTCRLIPRESIKGFLFKFVLHFKSKIFLFWEFFTPFMDLLSATSAEIVP